MGWTDASFAPEGARSHTGWLIFIDETPVSWRSSRQPTVTLSTAESELAASVEGALALVSIEALLSELGVGHWTSRLKTDSMSSLAIQKGSGSWRTRHLRIKANWICERIESQMLVVEHCAGAVQLADALTKALSSQRLKDLSWQMGLRPSSPMASNADSSASSSTAIAPSACGFKVLVALMVLSLSVGQAEAADGVIYEPMVVDYGLVMWCVFGLVALLWIAAWELIKYAGWQLYFSLAPGAGTRRMRRLQRIRDSTAEAIRAELTERRRVRDEDVGEATGPARDRALPRDYSRPGEVSTTSSSSSRLADAPLGSARTVYRDGQRDKAVQTTGPSFAPVNPEPRREVQVPERVHVVPGNQCFHVFNPCHAFRHRGTQERVQTLRICEFCVRHAGRDPQVPGPSIDDILRSGGIPNYDRPGARIF